MTPTFRIEHTKMPSKFGTSVMHDIFYIYTVMCKEVESAEGDKRTSLCFRIEYKDPRPKDFTKKKIENGFTVGFALKPFKNECLF